jgi:hypothetical protein
MLAAILGLPVAALHLVKNLCFRPSVLLAVTVAHALVVLQQVLVAGAAQGPARQNDRHIGRVDPVAAAAGVRAWLLRSLTVADEVPDQVAPVSVGQRSSLPGCPVFWCLAGKPRLHADDDSLSEQDCQGDLKDRYPVHALIVARPAGRP